MNYMNCLFLGDCSCVGGVLLQLGVVTGGEQFPFLFLVVVVLKIRNANSIFRGYVFVLFFKDLFLFFFLFLWGVYLNYDTS